MTGAYVASVASSPVHNMTGAYVASSIKPGSQYDAGAYVASVASSLVHNNDAGAYVASVGKFEQTLRKIRKKLKTPKNA